MVRRVAILGLLAGCTVALGPTTAHARGLLGERYASVQLGLTRPGNSRLRGIDSSVFGFGAGLNWPVAERVDLNVAFTREELDGRTFDITSTAVIGGANYLIWPDGRTCPFLAGRLGIVDADPGGSDPLIAFGGGLQFDVNEKAALTPSLTFIHVDDASDVVLAGEGNYWITDRFFGLAGLGFGLDEGDIVLTVGAGLQF